MKLSDLDLQQMTHVLKKIEELRATDGWDILKQIMASEREVFFRKMAEPTSSIIPEVIHYNRGIIESTYRIADLPDRVILELQNRIHLAQATKQAAALPQKGNP